MNVGEQVKTIAAKITELGGELAPPATPAEIAQLEARLGFSLPTGLLELLQRHNGSSKETEEAIWRFWPCSEITTYRNFRGDDDFCPDINDLRIIEPSAQAVKLPGSRLILFADSLIDAPTYGIFHSPGHRCDGWVFDCSMGYLSATDFEKWIAAFVAHGEDGLLCPESSMSKSSNAAGAAKSRGGIYLAGGLLFLILGGLVTAMPGGRWPVILIAFAFSVAGCFVARGRARRWLAVVLTGLSGWLFLQDFLIWLAL